MSINDFRNYGPDDSSWELWHNGRIHDRWS